MFYHFLAENARKTILATAVSFLGTEEEMREKKKKTKRISAYDLYFKRNSTCRSSYEERAQRRKSVRKAFSSFCALRCFSILEASVFVVLLFEGTIISCRKIAQNYCDLGR